MQEARQKQQDYSTGDVIVKMGGKDITSMQDISGIKKFHSSGDTVTVDMVRNNQTLQLSLTFEVLPSSYSSLN